MTSRVCERVEREVLEQHAAGVGVGIGRRARLAVEHADLDA